MAWDWADPPIQVSGGVDIAPPHTHTYTHTHTHTLTRASQVALMVKNPPANAGNGRDAGSILASLVAQIAKNPPAMQKTQV